MEHIKEVIGKLGNPANIASQIRSSTTDNSQPIVEDEITKLRRLNLSSIEHTFEKFQINVANKETYEAFLSLLQPSNTARFLFVYGTTGNGKTWLCEALAIAWLKSGKWVKYRTVSELLRELRNTLNKNSKVSMADRFEWFVNEKRLILDDFGAGMKETSWELTTLEDLIDERYHHRFWDKESVTVMTSNADIKDIPSRIISRFHDPGVGLVTFNRDADHRTKRR